MSKIRYVKNNECGTTFPNFKKEEFRCFKYCNGFPCEIAYSLLEVMQNLRNKYGPIHIHSGVRCKFYNAELNGSSAESDHLQGCACDWCFDLHIFDPQEKEYIMSYIRKLPNVKYTYTNQSNMYNGIHISVYPTYEEENKILAPKPIEENTIVNQVKVLANSTIYCRLSPDNTIENKTDDYFIKIGYYDVLDEIENKGYHWYKIGESRWIAQVDGYVEYIPKYVESVIENNPIEEEKGQVSPIIPSEPETLENEPKNEEIEVHNRDKKNILLEIINKILEYLRKRFIK